MSGVGDPPPEHEEVGYCSQMAVFVCQSIETSKDNNTCKDTCCDESVTISSELHSNKENDEAFVNNCSPEYKLVTEFVYPFDDKLKNRDQKIINETEYIVNHSFSDISDETEETFTREISVKELLSFPPGLKNFLISEESFVELIRDKYCLSSDQQCLLVTMHLSDFMRDSLYSDLSDNDDCDDDDFDLDVEIYLGNVQDAKDFHSRNKP